MSVFQRFKETRIALNFTQNEFASKLKVFQRDISRFEKGKAKNIPSSVMLILHENFNVNINWLLTGEGKMFQNETAINISGGTMLIAETAEDNIVAEGSVVYKTSAPTSNESIGDRIALLIKELGMNKNSFSKKIGLASNSVLENILGKRKNKPSYDVISKIVRSVKNLNSEWLLMGEGEMFTGEHPVQLHEPVPFYASMIELPYLPAAARATFSDMGGAVTNITDTYKVLQLQGYDYSGAIVIEINGDSMEPTLIDKEKVLVKELPKDKWAYHTGLVAISFNDMFVVKRIAQNFDGELTLQSDNPLGGTFKVKIDDVHSIYTLEHSVFKPIR